MTEHPPLNLYNLEHYRRLLMVDGANAGKCAEPAPEMPGAIMQSCRARAGHDGPHIHDCLGWEKPGWLEGEDWKGRLQSMTADDRAMLAEHWELAGGPPPGVDLTWVRTESIGDLEWPLWALGGVLGAGILSAVIYLIVVML